jgi:MSHA biogenesis protein MshL
LTTNRRPPIVARLGLYALLIAQGIILQACTTANSPQAHGETTLGETWPRPLPTPVWARQVSHQRHPWLLNPSRFSFRLENIPASQVLEVLSNELKLSYSVDSCGENRVSLVGKDMSLMQVVRHLEQQSGASVQLHARELNLRCEQDELRIYTLDYLSIARQMNDSSSLSSAISGNTRDSIERRDTGNRSELVLNNIQQHDLWQSIASQIDQVMQTELKPVEISTRERLVDEDEERTHASRRHSNRFRDREPSRPSLNSATLIQTERRDITTTRKETRSGRVVVNPESGTVAVVATPSQHKRVAAWLTQIQQRVDKQIVIEAVITEIMLNQRYERGIDWNILRQNGLIAGLAVQGAATANPVLTINAARNTTNSDTSVVLRLLEEFGKTSVLSSPRVVTMNQQAAVLKVIDNRVYFTTDVQTSAPTQNSPAFSTFTTKVQTVPVGFLMTVTPHIADNNAIQIRVRPTLSRIVGFVQDPNPALQQLNIISRVPEVQTRELESILRLKSGEMALLGGLRQKETRNSERAIPGAPEAFDLITQSEAREQSHAELVILLKATVLDSLTDTGLPHALTGTHPTASPTDNNENAELSEALASAYQLHQNGQTTPLEKLLELLSKRFPLAPEASYNLALLAHQQGKHAQAIIHLEQAERICEQVVCQLPLLTTRALIEGSRP